MHSVCDSWFNEAMLKFLREINASTHLALESVPDEVALGEVHREQQRRVADEEDRAELHEEQVGTIAGVGACRSRAAEALAAPLLLLCDSSARYRSPLATTELSTSFVLLSYVADRFMLPCARANLPEEPRESSPPPVAPSLLTKPTLRPPISRHSSSWRCAGAALARCRRSRRQPPALSTAAATPESYCFCGGGGSATGRNAAKRRARSSAAAVIM